MDSFIENGFFKLIGLIRHHQDKQYDNQASILHNRDKDL